MFPLRVSGSVRLQTAPSEATLGIIRARIAEMLNEAGAEGVSISGETISYSAAGANARAMSCRFGGGRIQVCPGSGFVRVRYSTSMTGASIGIAICLLAYWAFVQFSNYDALSRTPSLLPWLCLVWLWLTAGFWAAISIHHYVWLKTGLRHALEERALV